METPMSSASTLDIEKQTEPIQAPKAEQDDSFQGILARQLSKVQTHRSQRRPSRADNNAPADAEATPSEKSSSSSSRQGPGSITGFRWVLVCLALYLSIFMYGLDTTIAADVQSAVVETYGTVGQLAWLGAGFPLGSVAVILPYGSLFTHFNMKWAYIGGIVLFEVGSALCGGAPNMGALIVGRVIAGAGGTGMYLGGLTHFSALVSPKVRGTYITGIAFVWGIGSVLGPVVGGAFSDSAATWRWAFYLNLVIGAVTAPVYLFYLPAVQPPAVAAAEADGTLLSVRARLARLDYVGFVLSAAAWVTLSLALVAAGTQWAWSDGRTIATLVVFGVLFVGYILQQYFCWFTTPETRSFPGHLIAPGHKNARTHILLYMATSAAITTLFVPTYYIPVYFQFVQNDTALMAAVRLLPFILVTVTSSLASSFLLRFVKYYMPVYVFAGVLITLSGALLYVYLDPATSIATIYGLSILGAVGTGLTLQTGYQVGTLVVDDPADMGHVISMQNVSQIGSTVLALVVAGQIFQSVAVDKLGAVLAGLGYSSADIQSAVAGTQSALFESLEGDLRAQAVRAVTQAIQAAFVPMLAAGALLVVAGACMRREKLAFDVVVAA